MVKKIGWYVLVALFGLFYFLLVMLSPVHAEHGLTWADLEADIQTITKGDLSWSDSVWMELGNMGIQLVGSWADCSVDTTTIYFVADQAEYALPVAFERVWAVVNRYTYKVYERMPLKDRGLAGTGTDDDVQKTYSYGSPKGKLGKVIGFYPTPPMADSALVYFFKNPDIIDDSGDTVDIIEYYHPAVVTACLIYVNERLGGSTGKSEANRLWALLSVELNNAKARMESTPPDIIISPRTIGRAGQ